MSNTNCNIINDLLPLYDGNTLSRSSKNFIEEHIKECDSCKQKFAEIAHEEINESDVSFDTSKKKVKKKLVWKQIWIGFVSAMLTFAILFTSVYFVFDYKIKVKYESIKDDIVFDTGHESFIIYLKDGVYSGQKYRDVILKKDDTNRTIEKAKYIIMNQTLWDKVIADGSHSCLYNQSSEVYNTTLTDEKGNEVEYQVKIVELYYDVVDGSKYTEPVLIWKEK